MSNQSDPGQYAVAVTPSNATVLSPTRALWVGTAGDVTVRMWRDQTIVAFVGVPAGTMLSVCVDQVRSTGTTAGAITAVW